MASCRFFERPAPTAIDQAPERCLPQDTHPFPSDVIRERWLADLGDPAVDSFVIVRADTNAGFAATRGNEFIHFGTDP